MKIIILGAGQVGRSLAESLVQEEHDVTIVDQNMAALRELRDKLDVRTQLGIASHPTTLESSGIKDAEMLIAVTNNDETNIVACQIAYSLYHTPTKLARIRSSEYLKYPQLFNPSFIPIDVLISPEQLVTDYIYRLINHPGALQVLNFAEGHIQLVAVKAYYGGPLVGHELTTLKEHIPEVKSKEVTIFRGGRAIIPNDSTVIDSDDEVFFLASPEHIRTIISELRKLDKPYKRIMIAGGGSIGRRLAHILENARYHVKIIEVNSKRASYLAEVLDKTIVLEGDSADESLLLEENIENIDIFLTLTNDDEVNILSAMLAKRLGARRVISLINRTSYVDLVETSTIDLAISPQQVTIGALLTHVRRGDIVSVHSLRRGAAEAIEVIAHGDDKTSRVIGRKLKEIKLPPATTIGAIIRNKEVIIASDDIVIEEEDHILMLLSDKRYIPAVEKLFQVGVTFL
jgi:trk system potassium uptake protein TrkA